MDRKPYEAPQVITLGALEELTTQELKCTGSADAVLPRCPSGDGGGDAIGDLSGVP